MSSEGQRVHPLEKPSVFVLALLVSFIVVLGVACLIAYNTYNDAINHTIRSNGIRADLLAKIILEYQRATIGVIRSYGSRQLLVDSVKKKNFEEAISHLSSLVKNNPEIEMTFITDPGGTLWANFPIFKEAFKQNLSYRDWYKGVSKEWTPYVSGVYRMIVGEKELAVSVCSPIRDKKGKVIGILAVTQTTGFFKKIFNEIELDVDAKITLIDQEGHIIYTNRFPYKREVVDYPSFEFVKKAMGGEKGNVEIRDTSDGDKIKYVSFAPIRGIGWSVIVEKAKSDVLRSEFTDFLQTGIISILAFTVILLSLVYLRGKFRQMAALKALSEQLAMTNEQCLIEIGERKRTEDALRKTEKQLRLISAQRLTAQEQESKRIAAEIHDSIGAALSAIRFKVDNIIEQMEQGTAARESLTGILPTVQQAINESRRMQANLRPSILDDLGILPTIEWQCREYQRMYPHIRVEKQIDVKEDKVPDSLKSVIYRISQEALNNIAKHSKADLVILSLQKTGNPIELVIQDNGQGFDVKETLSKESYKRGLGLSSMRERAELSGGSFNIESIRGKGTTIRVSWPNEQ
ncbi:MAG TPA: cache domain-containing protein [Thermodesulfobacteriota bacterium]|nr:cache domain-containing protein [Thermodesulfobacteriota bacterium]